MSTLGAEFELFCLQRWFALWEWMSSSEGVPRCIFLDSDILVFSNLEEAELRFRKAPMTMIVCSAHTSFINSLEALGRFCELIEGHYQNDVLLDRLRRLNSEHMAEHGAGGISDMTFLKLFRRASPELLISIEAPVDWRYAFDRTLDTDFGGYAMKRGAKDILWKENVPYCRHLASSTLIRFETLHFQGVSKPLMARMLGKLPLRLHLRLWVNATLLWIGRLRRKLRAIRLKVEVLRSLPLSEAAVLVSRSIAGDATRAGRSRDEFVFANTVEYVLRAGGACTLKGSGNILCLPKNERSDPLLLYIRRGTTDCHIFNQIFRHREYFPVLGLLERAGVEKDVTIVDAGANIGCSPIWWTTVWPHAQVIAIEAELENYLKMIHNVHLNRLEGQITPLHRALWPKERDLSINRDFRDGREYSFAVRPEISPSDVTVKGITMENIRELTGWNEISLLKMDIEGAEGYLLEDLEIAAEVLKNVKVLAVEIHDDVVNRVAIRQNIQKLGFELLRKHETLFCVRKVE